MMYSYYFLPIVLISSLLVLSSASVASERRQSSSDFRAQQSSNMTVSMPIAQADFALTLLGETENVDQPVILSPFSIATALAVAYLGAEGKTKEEMNAVLSKGNTDEEFHHFLIQRIEEISKGAEGYTLTTANRLYYNEGFSLKENFINAVKAKYSGQLESADFKHPEALVVLINKWVEEQTHNKIKNLVSSDNIKEDSSLMIVNAVYFKGDWASKFDKSRSAKEFFYASKNSKREVQMMQKEDKFSYYEDGDVQVLGLPYKGDEVHMFVFLPVERFGLGKLLDDISGQKLLSYIDEARIKNVKVKMPKFKLESKLELSKVLAKMGMEDAFTTKADFSGISRSPLYISDVIHKAFVEVNEEGTEAAAATAIGMRLRSAPMPILPPISFIADHPFIFVIVKADSLLFIGKYA